jgi:phospholipid-binding lipoprotein MlaA
MKRASIILFLITFVCTCVLARGNAHPKLKWRNKAKFPKQYVVMYYDHLPISEESTEFEIKLKPNEIEEVQGIRTINDPLEPINRVTFFLNDKIYRYAISPVGHVYEAIIPSFVRDRFSNFLNNIAFPRYFLGALFQGKFDKSFVEVQRFLVNSTFGIGGLFDVADHMGIQTDPEDFGQVFAHWGMGHGFYFILPILGPSSGRDSFGLIFDTLSDGRTYFTFAGDELRPVSLVVNYNQTLMRVRDYQKLADERFDPYVIIRDLYYAYREVKLRR